MEIIKNCYFLKVEKTGFVDSSSILAFRDEKGLTCIEIGGGGQKNISQTLALFERQGLNISDTYRIIISHTHADHMGAIAHFRKMIPGLVVIDHEADASFLQDNTLLNRAFDADLVARYFPGHRFDVMEFYEAFCPISEAIPDQAVTEGDTLACGDFSLEVIHTPGHHPGHISLYAREQGMLFVGDMVGMEVPFYTPSSGGASGYLQSMEKYLALEVSCIIPSHGDLIDNPKEAVAAAGNKVKGREERLLSSLKAGAKSFTDLMPALFRSSDQYMFPGACILASHLEKLKEEGRVVQEGDIYCLLS